MIASLARHLRQSIDQIEEWPVEKFFYYHDAMIELLEAERPEG